MIHIVTDTTASLLPEFCQQHPIPVIPQVINFGTDSYLEGVEIDLPTFMHRLTTERESPKTAAPPPELFTKEFKRLAKNEDTILCIHPSDLISGTVRSATVAAADFPDADIRIIDTRVIASPLATMVALAVQWVEAGDDASTIETRLREMSPRWKVYFMVPTLEYLARGGRIGGAAALLGSVLQIKPILALQDGQVESFEKERTKKRALARLKELVMEQIPRDREAYLSVMHAGVPAEGQALADEFAAVLHLNHVPVHDVPPAIVTHAGPGLLGVAFQGN